MTQQQFNDLSKRYLEGNTTQAEEELLTKWLEKQPNLPPLNLSNAQKKGIEKRIWLHITAHIRHTKSKVLTRFAWLSGIAACLLIGVIWLSDKGDFLGQSAAIPIMPQEVKMGIELKNTTDTEEEIKLEDGTIVTLKPNSSLVYDNKTFNYAKREVYLKGEAFFIVKRDITKSFIVHTGELVTEVLGTSFSIKQNDKSNTIEVAVRTGKVSVYAEKPTKNEERNGVILTPNQRVMFDVVSKNIVPSIVENPVPILTLVKSQPNLVFQTSSLQTVLNSLSQLYGIEFVIANPKAKDCHITADLNGLSMFTQIELICKSIDATYEKRGTVVFINGDGCE